jgi:hypothetical protein
MAKKKRKGQKQTAPLRDADPVMSVDDLDLATKSELEILVGLSRKYLWNTGPARRYIERQGIHITKCYFYSEIPSLDEIDDAFEYREGHTTTDVAPVFFDDSVFGRVAIDAFLDALQPFSIEFDPPRKSKQETKFTWENSQFSFSDAMAYYCMIRLVKPQTIVEVGSGFSTLVAREAIARNGHGRLVCIEPYPRDFLEGITDIELVQSPVQQVSRSFFDQTLRDDDILFIDSTHTVKTGSDCVYLYLKVLPELRKRLMVHTHDVRLPFPRNRGALTDARLFWTEQYLVYALLLNNPMFSVCYGSDYHFRFNNQKLAALMHGRYPHGGVSLWYQKKY